MRRFFKEGAYLNKKHYLRKYVDFKISKTKPITKEPSLVGTFQCRLDTFPYLTLIKSLAVPLAEPNGDPLLLVVVHAPYAAVLNGARSDTVKQDLIFQLSPPQL